MNLPTKQERTAARTARLAKLSVTPISEMTEAEFAYALAHREDIKALEGTPALLKAERTRSAEEHAKRVAHAAHMKKLREERAFRAKDNAATAVWMKAFYNTLP